MRSAHACTRSELRGASCEDWKSAFRAWEKFFLGENFAYISNPFSYPVPFLRAVRRGALAKSITGYHKNMVRKQYPVLELANQMPVRIWIWPPPAKIPTPSKKLYTFTHVKLCLPNLFYSMPPPPPPPAINNDQSLIPMN